MKIGREKRLRFCGGGSFQIIKLMDNGIECKVVG